MFQKNEIHSLETLSTRDWLSIQTIIQATLTQKNPHHLINTLMNVILSSAEAETGILLLLESERFKIRARCISDKCEIITDSQELTPISMINWVCNHLKPLIIPNAITDPFWKNDSYIQHRQPRSILCFPLSYQSQILGIIHLENTCIKSDGGSEALAQIQLLINQVSISIKNLQISQKNSDIPEAYKPNTSRESEKFCQNIQAQKLCEERLRTSEAKLRSYLAALREIVLVIDQDKNIEVIPTYFSNCFEPEKDLLHHTIEQFFQTETAEIWFNQIQTVLETQETRIFNYSLTTSNQEVEFSANIAPSSDNSVIWVARAMSDQNSKLIPNFITHRHKQEQFLRSIYDGVDSPIFVIDIAEDGEFHSVG